MDSKHPSTIYTAEADAAFTAGHWARAAALYDEALDAMPQTTRKERIEWSRVARLQQSAADSAAFISSVRR
jgi:hypothetical protein